MKDDGSDVQGMDVRLIKGKTVPRSMMEDNIRAGCQETLEPSSPRPIQEAFKIAGHVFRFRLDAAVDSPQELQEVLRNLDYLIAARKLLDEDALTRPGAHYAYSMEHIASSNASSNYDRQRIREMMVREGMV